MNDIHGTYLGKSFWCDQHTKYTIVFEFFDCNVEITKKDISCLQKFNQIMHDFQ
jgi:hypothetical protein